jgi:transcription-repair coupling factor (superfamily II helicase)
MHVLQSFIHTFESTYKIGDLAARIEKTGMDLCGLPGSSRALFVAALFRNSTRGVLLLTKNNREALDFTSDLAQFMDPDDIHLLVSKETLPYDDTPPAGESLMRRVRALAALGSERKSVVLVPVRAFLDYLIPPSILERSSLCFEKGGTHRFETLVEKLSVMGYERVDRVNTPGTFSVRGDILDVYANGAEHPARVEFFDDTIEEIRHFSPLTQRSTQPVERLQVLPATDLVIDREAEQRLSDLKNQDNEQLVDSVLGEGDIRGLENFLPLLYERPATVPEYAGDRFHFIINDPAACREMADFFHTEAARIYQGRGSRFLLPPQQVLLSLDDLLSDLTFSAFTSLPELGNGTVNFRIQEKRGYHGQITSFKEDIGRFLDQGYKVVIGGFYEGQTNRVRDLLTDMLSEHSRLEVQTLDLNEGFVSGEMKLAVIMDREIFNRRKRHRTKTTKVESQPIDGITSIREGDYIVHIEHGIGIYRGIERLHTGGVEKDFVKIEYREGDEIFIPVDQINLLQKYIGQEGRRPRIDKIGSGTWNKVKEHVRKSVRDMARELLKLYSVRASMRGHAFGADTEWQFQFESGFRYEETPDQLRTIEEIKADMEDPRPMDRLICGDVGFGKTEVAIRASFKAVMEGKQVAILVPTTVLAEQHYNTFTDRFSGFPIVVDMLSRFRTPKEQRQLIENLKNGVVDMVVGTHRLIQKDVKFKDLGLVIIDEEQRFGVEHKERLKQLRKLVDVIAMTATPIPRTLYMSMTRIRDMSVIETPPKERVPIETHVLEYNDTIVQQAIRREVERGGQVFYVHNRVKTIDERAETIRKLVPGVSVQAAHGQMDEHELEEIMQDFFNREFQVIVTTTIIESGLDIPNVNTIIIERADRFGLSQLYQLRGRVGRSRRKAYAYLLYPGGRVVGEQAQKRLTVINDHTELGAGYSIALKDLELRGAGNILGSQQHGEMLAVGFEMYVKLLDDAIRELKGADEIIDVDPVLDVSYRGYIPAGYVENERARIELYKRMAGLRSIAELNDLAEELVDRFGALPAEVDELLQVVRLKVLCRAAGVKHLREKQGELHLTFEKSKVDIISLIQKINQDKRTFSISPKDYNTLYIYRRFDSSREKYDFLKELFDFEEDA